MGREDARKGDGVFRPWKLITLFSELLVLDVAVGYWVLDKSSCPTQTLMLGWAVQLGSNPTQRSSYSTRPNSPNSITSRSASRFLEGTNDRRRISSQYSWTSCNRLRDGDISGTDYVYMLLAEYSEVDLDKLTFRGLNQLDWLRRLNSFRGAWSRRKTTKMD